MSLENVACHLKMEKDWCSPLDVTSVHYSFLDIHKVSYWCPGTPLLQTLHTRTFTNEHSPTELM